MLCSSAFRVRVELAKPWLKAALPKSDGGEYHGVTISNRRRRAMTDAEVEEFMRRAEHVYATRLRAILEPEHIDEFVSALAAISITTNYKTSAKTTSL